MLLASYPKEMLLEARTVFHTLIIRRCHPI